MQDMALTVPEVSQKTRIGRNAVYKAVQNGELRVVRIGRKVVVPVAAVSEWLQRMAAEPGEAANE